MRHPMAWVGLGTVLGAWSWPWWRPSLELLLVGVVLLAGVAGLGRRWRVSHGAWGAAAFLLGAAACAALPPAPVLPARAAVLGEVLRVSGREALVETEAGRMALIFSGDPPAEGTRLAALTAPIAARAVLPGAWDPDPGGARSQATRRRVVRWTALGGAPAEPLRFSAARHGPLLVALVTGSRAEVPPDELRLLKNTGTTHLLAISGQNIALVAGVAAAVASVLALPLAWLSRPWAARLIPALAAFAAACAYADAVGWPVSARRALVMVAAGLAARVPGRRSSAWNALGLAACALTLSDPSEVDDLAFLLSFGAVAGILWVGPRLMRWVPPDTPRPLRALASAVAITVGATAGTLPLAAWVFQTLPPLSPLANLVAVPLLGGIGGSGALLAARGPAPLRPACLWAADQAADLTLRALHLLDRGIWHPAVGPGGALLLAGMLPLRRFPAACAGLALFALGLREVPVGVLQATFLSVGQGDAALLRWPDGRAWLIDGGPPSEQLLGWLRREGIRRLDAIFLSHPDADHLGGLLPVAAALPVGAFWAPRPPAADELDYASLWAGLEAAGVPRYFPGDPPPPGVELLWPDPAFGVLAAKRSDNDESLVLLVSFGSTRLLFPGDIEGAAEAWLAESLPPVSVVKVPHHGSKTSSSAAFVAATRPELAVVSVGAGNSFGHPSPEVLDRWRGVPLLRTDQDGTVELRSDGHRMKVRTWRSGQGWRDRGLP